MSLSALIFITIAVGGLLCVGAAIVGVATGRWGLAAILVLAGVIAQAWWIAMLLAAMTRNTPAEGPLEVDGQARVAHVLVG